MQNAQNLQPTSLQILRQNPMERTSSSLHLQEPNLQMLDHRAAGEESTSPRAERYEDQIDRSPERRPMSPPMMLVNPMGARSTYNVTVDHANPSVAMVYSLINIAIYHLHSLPFKDQEETSNRAIQLLRASNHRIRSQNQQIKSWHPNTMAQPSSLTDQSLNWSNRELPREAKPPPTESRR